MIRISLRSILAVKLLLLLGLCWAVSTSSSEGTTEVSFLAEDDYSFLEQQHQLIRVGNSSSCWGHDNCYDCTGASRCHWCKHDQKCHVVGSVYGCLTGMNCDKPDDNNDDDDKHKPDKDTCATYTTCSQCASYRSCHWCAHDDSCHTVGSVYGCLRGVNCYSNDRCRRDIPEPLPPDSDHFTHMGFVPLFLVALIGGSALMCTSFCLCCACGVKGAYDDLCFAAYRGGRDRGDQDTGIITQQEPGPSANLTEALLSDAPAEADTHIAETAASESQQRIEEGETDNPAREDAAPDENEAAADQEESPLLRATATAEPVTPGRHGSKHARRMMSCCTALYMASVVGIGGVMLGAMRLFPKIPEYSVCNDNMAWKSLIDSMTSMKVEVDFEILMSISNENHFDVALDMGRGIFKHGGATIGHYNIPPVQAPSMAITDVMIIATLLPDKWEAMSLTAEYYEGKLVLNVDAELNVRAPSLFNFSKEVTITDKKVYINKQADRHLCACKKWDSNSTNHHYDSRGLLELGFDFDADFDLEPSS